MLKKSSKQGKSNLDRSIKRTLILGKEKKGRSPLIWIAGLLGLLMASGFLFLHPGGEDVPMVEATPSAEGSKTVSYPVALFDDGQARHFRHRVDDHLTVNYFILKSSDGIIRSAFDACDVCWPAGKGYVQSGDFMVCRNCGRRFASVRVNEVKGGCNPAPLNRKVVDGRIVILVEDIEKGKGYFDFSGRG